MAARKRRIRLSTRKDKREFPKGGDRMSTEQYVKAYFDVNKSFVKFKE